MRPATPKPDERRKGGGSASRFNRVMEDFDPEALYVALARIFFLLVVGYGVYLLFT